MAVSAKQIVVNRRNAKRSTGPSTPEGKAVASRNAIKHGLHACDIILKSTHPTSFLPLQADGPPVKNLFPQNEPICTEGIP